MPKTKAELEAQAKAKANADAGSVRTSNTTEPTQADADEVALTVSEDVVTYGTPEADAKGKNRATQPNLDGIDKLLLAVGYDTNYNALKLARAGMNESALIKANRQFLSDLMLKIPEQYIANYNQNVDYIDELLNLFDDEAKSVPAGAGYFETASNMPLVSNPEYTYLPKNADGTDKFKFPKFVEKVNLIDVEKIV
ncbi:unnamed protein product [Didymodactylos carnosus]|uniref:Uncharacterized protein n=1 Tax=Didymodactylos carnosus TaxID=1234261 RepID=A0A8S2HPX3_9BILA|nr:unnamed protein product [Didymodactylos carnosus]CAF3670416.1 unnamed protein product [Didymodactylos carnosus]